MKDFTTDIASGTMRRVSTGRVSGACATAGVHVATLTATNLAGESGSRDFVFGFSSEVESAAASSAGADAEVVQITVPGGKVRIAGKAGDDVEAGKPPVSLVTWKAHDTRLLIIRFVTEAGVRVDPDPDTLRITIKEYEPEGVLVTADDFEKSGAGETAEFALPITFTGAGLAGALSEHEDYAEPALRTVALCLADIEWTREITHNSVPVTLTVSTQTFGVSIERDIAG